MIKERSRREYDADFKQQELQMITNERAVREVAESLGIGENLIYRWRSRQQSKGTAEKENAGVTMDQQVLLRRIRELEQGRATWTRADARLLVQKSLRHFQPAALKERYMFVSGYTQKWPVQVVCQVLQLSCSAYYSWLSSNSKTSNQQQNKVQTPNIETFSSTAAVIALGAWWWN